MGEEGGERARVRRVKGGERARVRRVGKVGK